MENVDTQVTVQAVENQTAPAATPTISAPTAPVFTADQLAAMTKDDLAKLRDDLAAAVPVVESAIKAAEEKALAEAKVIADEAKQAEADFIAAYGEKGWEALKAVAIGVILLKVFGVI